jgi:hypothetical protein
MKLLLLICTVWLVASCPSWADDQQKRFLEFPSGNDTTTFDLNTVQIIQPGRFTIISTALDDPDVMKFRLKAIEIMRSHCARPGGKYPAPPDVLTLGPPDMSVEDIEVIAQNQSSLKHVKWSFPYKRFASGSQQGLELFVCERQSEYSEVRRIILNGIRMKRLFDCKRGLLGVFVREDDDPTKAITGSVPIGSRAFEYYLSACQAVTHEAPYVPE